MAWRSWTCDYSKLSPVSKKTATTRRNASSIMIRTGGGHSAPIPLRCAATLRQTSVLRATPALRLTTELSPSTTLRSTRRSFATSGPTTSIRATLATYVPLLTLKKSCRLTFFIKWSRTMTSICFTSRQSGAPSTTRSGAISEMNVSMPTIGRTSAASRTSTSIRLGSSVTFGPPRKKQGSILMAATLNTAVLTATDGRRKSTTRTTTKSMSVTASLSARRSTVRTITQKARCGDRQLKCDCTRVIVAVLTELLTST